MHHLVLECASYLWKVVSLAHVWRHSMFAILIQKHCLISLSQGMFPLWFVIFTHAQIVIWKRSDCQHVLLCLLVFLLESRIFGGFISSWFLTLSWRLRIGKRLIRSIIIELDLLVKLMGPIVLSFGYCGYGIVFELGVSLLAGPSMMRLHHWAINHLLARSVPIFHSIFFNPADVVGQIDLIDTALRYCNWAAPFAQMRKAIAVVYRGYWWK